MYIDMKDGMIYSRSHILRFNEIAGVQRQAEVSCAVVSSKMTTSSEGCSFVGRSSRVERVKLNVDALGAGGGGIEIASAASVDCRPVSVDSGSIVFDSFDMSTSCAIGTSSSTS